MTASDVHTGLDVERIRADFPILRREINGRPIAYLDSANSAQKPRQMIDAMSNFYATSYANVHRAVYALGVEATEAFEGTRAKVRALHERALRARGDLHARHHRGDQPRRLLVRAAPTSGPAT